MRRGAKERQPKDRVKMINGNLIRNWREVKLYIISASGERTLSEMRGAERRWRELSGEAVRNKMRGGGE